MKPIKIQWVVLLLSMGLNSLAQQGTTTSGGTIIASGGTVSYSIGQVVYTTNTAASGTVSQGVQQAYEVYTLGIEDTELNLLLLVFPNPTTDHLILQVNGFTNEQLSYQLFDLEGKLLNNGRVNTQQTQINTTNFSSGTYLLKVIHQDNKAVQSFKIIKK